MTLTWDDAERFVKTHAPRCGLSDAVTTLNGACFHSESKLIVWNLSFGIDVLCHELGHAVLGVTSIRHWYMPSPEEQKDEIAAWLWAEEICHIERWYFDYEKAEKGLRSYGCEPPAWKYKRVKNEN